MAGTVSATIKINDAFSATLNKLKSGLGSSATAMNKLKNNASGASSGGGMFKQFLGANVIGAGVTKGIGLITSSLGDAITRVDTLNNATRSFQNMGFSALQTKKAMSSLDTSINGLPTSMDSAVRNTQLLAASTGNIGKSTKIFKAMNDGILGFGGTAGQVDSSVVQLSQAFSNGKVDMATWNSMINGGMGPALNSIAKTMGMTTGQLKSGLSTGKVSVKKFQDSLIQLDQEGGGGMKSLSKIAQDSTSGLGTALTNFHTAMVRAVAGGVSALAKGGLTDFINNMTSGLKAAVPQIESSMKGIVSVVTQTIPKLAAGIQPLKEIAPYVIAAVGAFAGISAISSILTSVSAGAEAAGTGLINFVTKIQAMPAQILSVFSTLGSVFGALGAPIIIALAVVTVAVVAAVYAWQTNFAGIRDFMSSVFGNMGSIFAPLVSAFDELKSALAPVANVLLPMLGQALGMIGVGVIVSIAVAFAALADALRIVVSVGAAVVHAVMAIVQGMQALHQAMTGDFSGAASSLSKAKNSISGIGDALSHIGDKSATSQVLSSLDQLGSKASSTKSQLSNIQVKPKLDTSNVFSQMDQMTAGKTAKVNVKPEIQAGANPFQTIQAQADSHPVKTKAQVDTTGVGNPLKQLQSQASANPIKAKVQADTSSTADPFQQIKSKAASTTIKPKVETPKVPTPTMPKGQTLHVKVATPKIPTPTRPASMPTLHVKVATPKIPTPTKPTMPTIAAPHVMRPSMAGVVSAVASGMRGAAAAARAGGAGISAAVRSSIASAVAAARAGAGAMRGAGAMIGAGLAAGMRSQVGAVAAAANALVAQANRAARAAASIHSPSKLFAEIGDYMGQGMALGMDGTGSLVAASGASMAHTAVAGAQGAVMPGFNPNASTPEHSPFATSVTPYGNSATSTTTTNQQSTGGNVTIAPGAIQINSTGKGYEDAEVLVARIEDYLMNTNERRG